MGHYKYPGDQNDPSAFSELKGFFDVILVDAPCSGEGMFRDTVAVNEWSEENTIHCSERQKRILTDVWPALKENGILIFSTCTFNPGENEANIKWLVSKYQAEAVELDISEFNGITKIDYQGINRLWLLSGQDKRRRIVCFCDQEIRESRENDSRNQEKTEL